MTHPAKIILYAAILLALCGCRQRSDSMKLLDMAEGIMETAPDSALALLDGMDMAARGTEAEKARYALLRSMALDKNYIDVTDFAILQPAVDYYIENGSPDQRLRTYYYQGRIFQNMHDNDDAMNSFAKALDAATGCKDSLTIVRALVAMAGLRYQLYDFIGYSECNVRAADISRQLSRKDYESVCLLNALNGAILSDDRVMADSLLDICSRYGEFGDDHRRSMLFYTLAYSLKYGKEDDLREIVRQDFTETDETTQLNLALAFNKLGETYRAAQLLDSIHGSGMDYDTLKYRSVAVPVLKALGKYEEALSEYESFICEMDSIDNLKINHKLQLIEEKSAMELKALKEAEDKARIIWWSISGIVILALVIFVLILLLRSHRIRKDLALQMVARSELENRHLRSEKDLALQRAINTCLENEKLKSEGERLNLEKNHLALENKNLQLERDKKILEAENLAHRVASLESESETLREIMNARKELPEEVQDAIKVRIEMLNSLLAGYITSNPQFEKPYDTWIKELAENKEKFMNTNRLAFQASHPRFIDYLEQHGLTVSEINYVCLYAIGLRGKEVGNYIKKRSHVNISSAIRKKLGIDKHDTNIGIYVRKLLKRL